MLRDYQQDCLTACLEHRAGGLCVLPTGSGKSHIIAELCHALDNKDVLVLTPRLELMRQNKEKIKNDTPCVTVNTAYFRKMSADILIIDEAHLIKPDEGMYQEIIKEAKIIYGFTATPFRMEGGELLGLTFTTLIYTIERKVLIDKQYLAPRHYIPIPDSLLLNIKNANFNSMSSLSKSVCPQTQQCLTHYLSIKKSPQALIFACDIKHALKIQKMLPNAQVIHSKLLKNDRDILINHFKQGLIYYLINCEILTTGFDYPSLREIIILRPTDSYTLYEQICGRGDRPALNKSHNTIYDYTLNYYYFKKLTKTNYEKHCLHCFEFTDYRLRKCKACGKP